MLKSKKQKLTELLRPIIETLLTEIREDENGYIIGYYESHESYGDTGKLYPDLKSALRAAILFSKNTDMNRFEYLGVEPIGNAKEFSVLSCSKDYLRIGSRGFDDPENGKIWLSVASKVANAQERFGGKQVVPQNGKFN